MLPGMHDLRNGADRHVASSAAAMDADAELIARLITPVHHGTG